METFMNLAFDTNTAGTAALPNDGIIAQLKRRGRFLS